MESRGLASGEDPRSIGPLYLVVFAHLLTCFRLPEFQAAADYLDVRYCFVPVPKAEAPLTNGDLDQARHGDPAARRAASEQAGKGINVERPFMLVHLANDEVAREIAGRVTCIRAIWQHWASAETLEGVKALLREEPSIRAIWTPWRSETITWRASVTAHMRTMTEAEKRERIESFGDVLNLPGPVRLRDPELDWCYAEEWTTCRLLAQQEESVMDIDRFVVAREDDGKARPQRQRLMAVHVGRKITDELARQLIGRMDVKKRAYIGNTTMESGMSLVQAAMALAGPGKLVYDPFAGTGSLLLAAAAFGAHVLASDIDARMLRGKPGKDGSTGITRSARQYGLESQFVDSLSYDVTQHPLRRGGLFDAIVADPPYGVRAGAKRLGRRQQDLLRSEPVMVADGVYSHEQADYLPPCKPYALDDLLTDLMAFAARMLVPRGRLVFWMPTMTDVARDPAEAAGEAQQLELRLPPTRDFRLVAHSLQDFGNWGRRLVTLEKVEASGDQEHDLRLPTAPRQHLQATATATMSNGAQSDTRRVLATDDPNEFRNQFFAPRRGKHEKKTAL